MTGQSARPVPGPEVQGALGVLCGHEVVTSQKGKRVWAANVVLEGGQVRPCLHIPVAVRKQSSTLRAGAQTALTHYSQRLITELRLTRLSQWVRCEWRLERSADGWPPSRSLRAPIKLENAPYVCSVCWLLATTTRLSRERS